MLNILESYEFVNIFMINMLQAAYSEQSGIVSILRFPQI